MTRKTLLALFAAFAIMTTALMAAPGRPKTVIHVITVQWKPEATQEQIDAAIRGAETMNYKGLKNVWTRVVNAQLPEGFKNIIVMEFESEKALKDYTDSDAQKAWYEKYLPIRGESRTHDISN
jgi:hypothetical protein